MKKILVLFCLISSCTLFSQKEAKFKPGVQVFQKEKINKFKAPSSILFLFEGDTHHINFFLSLEKKLLKRFKRKIKKSELGFNYNLKSNNPLDFDLKKIPKKVSPKKLYETICAIYISDYKWKRNLLSKTIQSSYRLNISLKDKRNKKLRLKLVLNVNSRHTILTQNGKISKLIYNHIMEL